MVRMPELLLAGLSLMLELGSQPLMPSEEFGELLDFESSPLLRKVLDIPFHEERIKLDRD